MLEWFRRMFALPPAASSMADDVDALHAFVIGTTLLASFGIAVVAAYFLVRYRRRGAPTSTPPAKTHGVMEVAVVGGLLALFLGWWLIGFRQYGEMQSVPANAAVVYVTAKQWMWKFSYPNGQSSNDVLTVEAGRPVELVMTSRDMIHSLFVPALRLKQDVLPGRYVTLSFEANRPGSYPIFCAEYCGVSHSNMLGELRVLSPEDYGTWLSQQGRPEDLVDMGRRVATQKGCLACHTVDGQPHLGPTWSRLFDSDVTLDDGTHVVADADYLTRSMMEPRAQIVKGYPTPMPSYLGLLDSTESAALVHYIRSLASGPIRPTVALPPVGPRDDAGTKDATP